MILDTGLSISENARVLTQPSSAQTVIAAGERADPVKVDRLEKKGARVLRLPAAKKGVDLEALMDELGKMKITGLLVEGGSRVSGAFLSAGLVDKICFFYAPKILGDGIPMCSGPGPGLIASAIPVAGIRTMRFDDDIMVEGYIG